MGRHLLAFQHVLNRPASIWRQQAHSWPHYIGRVGGQGGLDGTSMTMTMTMTMEQFLLPSDIQFMYKGLK